MGICGRAKAIEFGIFKTRAQVAKTLFLHIDHENGFAFFCTGFDIDISRSEKQQSLEDHAAAVDIPFAEVIPHFYGQDLANDFRTGFFIAAHFNFFYFVSNLPQGRGGNQAEQDEVFVHDGNTRVGFEFLDTIMQNPCPCHGYFRYRNKIWKNKKLCVYLMFETRYALCETIRHVYLFCNRIAEYE